MNTKNKRVYFVLLSFFLTFAAAKLRIIIETSKKGMENQGKGRIIIRIGRHHLSFSSIDMTQDENPITYEPYVVRSGISMAANMREALKDAELTEQGGRKAMVMVDVPMLLIPVEQFEVTTMEKMFHHAFPKKEQEQVLYNVLPDLNVVSVFAINKDLHTVLTDNFADVKIVAALSPVWRHLHHRSFTGTHHKLYGYFHDQRLDIFAFQQNRFKFYNQFETARSHDALYFLLYVWNQLMFSQEHDEMYLVGDIPERDWLTEELKKYVQKVYVINPSADFNRAPATQVKNMPYDLMTLLTKGR